MKIVIAISERDLALAAAQSELILKQGGVASHQCLLVVAPGIDHQDGVIASNLQRAFGRFERFVVDNILPSDPNAIQPHVGYANQMFQATNRYLARTNNNSEWYWFEPDCIPLHERWADELSRDYSASLARKKIYLGKFVPKCDYVRTPEGLVLKVLPDQNYMVGSGIYPARSRNGLWSQAKSTPWDVLMQWETTHRGTNTDKIIHNHSTAGYQVVAPGVVSCQTTTSPTRSVTQIEIPPTALVFHGCKDTSLIELVTKGLLYKENTPKKEKKTKAPKSNVPILIVE